MSSQIVKLDDTTAYRSYTWFECEGDDAESTSRGCDWNSDSSTGQPAADSTAVIVSSIQQERYKFLYCHCVISHYSEWRASRFSFF